MIRFICPQCKKTLQVDDNAAGKRVKCPQCGGAAAVPAGKQAPATAGAAVRKEPAPAPFADSGFGPLAPVARRHPQSLLLPFALGSIVLVGTAVALTLWATGQLSPKPNADAVRPRTDDVAPAASQPINSPTPQIAKSTAQGMPPADVPVMPAQPPAPVPAATPPASGITAQPVAPVPPAPAVPAPATVTTSMPSPAGRIESVDVLRQVNPIRDAARGAWMFQGTSLASPRNEVGVLRLPVTPPAEYRLTVVVERISTIQPSFRTITVQPQPSRSRYFSRTRPSTRTMPSRVIVPQPSPAPTMEADDGLDIVLSVGGHSTALVLDGWQRTLSGLELVDGKGVEQNATAFRGEVLTRLRPVTVICTVAPGSVDATVDGRTVMHWTGQSDRLSLEPEIAADAGNGLALIASGQFRIQRVELLPLSGTAPAVAASTGPAPSTGQVASTVPATTSPAYTVPSKSSVVPSPEAMQCVALIEHPLGSGSGFAIGKRLVVTNAHVVEGVFADEIKVTFGAENGKPQPAARILYFDRSRDLAVLDLPSDLDGLPIRSDYTFNVGDRVTLVGNPSAGGGILLRNAVNHGRFSSVVHIKEQDFYQIEASVNPGWSGGPVLDGDGKVVAIVAMKAADLAVAEIRGSMGKLDQEFRTRIGRTAYNVGLTYGIPAGALANILKDPDFQNEERQAAANDRCSARTLTDRLSFLAALCALRIQMNVPAKVRSEAAALAYGRLPSGVHKRPVPSEGMTFMSDYDISRLGHVLDTESVKSMESKFKDRLDERVKAVQASTSLPDAVKRDLQTLATKIRDGNKFAEHPPTTYMAFSVKAKAFSHDFKEHLKRLAENLKEKES